MGNPQFNLTDPPPACSAGPWQCVSGGDEQAVSGAISGYLSGGGFSSVDVRPAYQSAAVEAYFTSGVSLPDASAWNRTGRGFPDVSAIGYNGYIVDSGAEYLVSGTSMSTPIVAAIVALVAHDFYKMTNMTLGFLNPLCTARSHTSTTACALPHSAPLVARPFVRRLTPLISVCVPLLRWLCVQSVPGAGGGRRHLHRHHGGRQLCDAAL